MWSSDGKRVLLRRYTGLACRWCCLFISGVNTPERLHHPAGGTNHKISHVYMSLIYNPRVPYCSTLHPEPAELTRRAGPGGWCEKKKKNSDHFLQTSESWSSMCSDVLSWFVAFPGEVPYGRKAVSLQSETKSPLCLRPRHVAWASVRFWMLYNAWNGKPAPYPHRLGLALYPSYW